MNQKLKLLLSIFLIFLLFVMAQMILRKKCDFSNSSKLNLISGKELIEYMKEYEIGNYAGGQVNSFKVGKYYGFIIGISHSFNEIFFSIPTDVGDNQLVEVVQKYLRANQNEWNNSARDIVVAALKKAFPKK